MSDHGPRWAPAGSGLKNTVRADFFCRGSALRAGAADQPKPRGHNPEFSAVNFGMSVEVEREWVSLSFILRTRFTYRLKSLLWVFFFLVWSSSHTRPPHLRNQSRRYVALLTSARTRCGSYGKTAGSLYAGGRGLKAFLTHLLLPPSRCSEDLKLPGDEDEAKSRACYNVEFTFDADTQVAITIYYQAAEEFHNGVPV